ncbi:MAG: sporulation protein [Firmicutes bacterium]|nr:sporulation protein [Bacillota bacterium]
MSTLNDNFETLFSKMENFVSTKTVVGEPIKIGDMTLIPLVDVSFGLGAGSKSSLKEKHEKGGSAAGGLGAKISPTAIMIIQNGNVQILNVSNQTAIDKIVNMAPGIMNKLNFSAGARHKFEDEIITDKKDGEEE